MPSTPYAPLPTQPTQEDADRDLQDAFGDDDDDDDDNILESTRLINQNHHPAADPSFHRNGPQPIQIPGSYDFERDYDYTMPPPGSPPPFTTAHPNNYGNSNGLIPTSPIAIPLRSRQSSGFGLLLRKAVGSILPTHYQTLPTESPRLRLVGGGSQNDGVFANVMAKPVRSARTVTDDGSVFLAPETVQSQAPPSYAEAQIDAVPPYWETTVVAPSEPGEIIVDDLPTGSVLVFVFNLFISFFFQFIGFVFTYFLSTTHAARYGARAGLGFTFIQYGAYWRAAQNLEATPSTEEQQDFAFWNATMSAVAPNSTTLLESVVANNGTETVEAYDVGFGGKDWLALFFMTFGWVLLFTSLVGFWRVKRWEASIRASSTHHQTPIGPSDIAREVQVRRNLESIFGIGDQLGTDVDSQIEAEVRLARHLRAAGLL